MSKMWKYTLQYFVAHNNVAKMVVSVSLAVAVAVVGGVAMSYMHSSWQYYHLYNLRTEKKKICRKSLCDLDSSLSDSNSKSPENIIDLPFDELTKHLQDGKLQAKQVLEAYQCQALAVHKRTNCLIQPIFEAEPFALQCDMKTSVKGPLHGIPVSLKDNYGLKGYDSTIGCSKWIDCPFSDDAVIVKVLRKQGAVPFMKTNVPQTMISIETTNPIFGATTSLLDEKCERSVGGSSGGEGALLSGKGSILGFGSDIGGSIRIPSHMNGVYGFKPTCQRLSSKGTHPIYKGQTLIRGSYGPMGRDVETLVVAMRSLCVPYMYELDPTIPYQPFREEAYDIQKKLKIGFYLTDNFVESIPAVQRAVLEAKDVLESMGHQVVPWDYPELGRTAGELYAAAMFGDGGAELKTLLKDDAVDSAMSSLTTLWRIPASMRNLLYYVVNLVRPNVAAFLKRSTGLRSVSEWWECAKNIEAFRQEIIVDWRKNGLDAVIAPGFAFCALPFGECGKAPGAVTYTALFNMLDFPAGSLPVSTVTSADTEALDGYPTPDMWHSVIKKGMVGSEGLPVNVQVATLPWQDELCLRVMKDLETGLKH